MKNPIRWRDWTFPNFRINFKHEYNHTMATCGGCIISMITGEDPQKVDHLLKWNGDCVTEKLVAHLKRRGYETYQVGLREVPRYQTPYNWNAPSITGEHVVLFGSVTNPGEASWFLVNAGEVWHNFERHTNSPLFQLCNPADDVLLLRK